MSDVIFNEPRISQRDREAMRETSFVARWVMKISGGSIKNELQANFAILIFAFLSLLLSFFIFKSTGTNKPAPEKDRVRVAGPKGFTLIELLVVISVIGLLSSIVLSSLNSARIKARDARRISDLSEIRKALELYFNDNGYYPRSDCGWDCNGYRNSPDSAGWGALATDLSPYLSSLPKDPINNCSGPWNSGCYSYAYGNVGRSVNAPTYDLTAQFEDANNPQRCGIKNWNFYFDHRSWCTAFGGSYNNQIYEASF